MWTAAIPVNFRFLAAKMACLRQWVNTLGTDGAHFPMRFIRLHCHDELEFGGMGRGGAGTAEVCGAQRGAALGPADPVRWRAKPWSDQPAPVVGRFIPRQYTAPRSNVAKTNPKDRVKTDRNRHCADRLMTSDV